MATVPKEIDRFLGINKDNSGDTQLQLGESSYQKNFRITDSFKLKKLNGYRELFASLGFSIRGMWRGKISGAYHFLFAANGRLYEHNLTTGVNTDSGALSADAPTNFFAFNDKVYIQTGSEYKSWDGVTLANVVGYRPKVAIGTPPSGGIGPEANQGKEYEGINLLTGAKHQTFSPDGISVEFCLFEQEVDSIDFVKVNGDSYTENTNYKVDKVLGKVYAVPYDLPLGDSTTRIDVTKTRGNTYRYTWDGTGTDPGFQTSLAVKDTVIVSAENLNKRNQGTFTVTEIGTSYFEVTNKNGLVESDKTFGKGYIYKRMILGDSTTRIDITNPTGITFRYTYDATGTNPGFETKLAVNDYVFINVPNFNSFNNGVFKVTAVGTSYFEVDSENGVAEVDKVYGTGGIYKCLTTGKPIGLIETGTPDNVDIGWTKGTGSRSEVYSHKFAMFFGGKNDSRIFLYGNGTNKYIYSGLADGVPSAEYFPAFNNRTLGSDEFAITDLARQYDRQIIYTDGGEAYYSYYDTITDVNGNTIADFPTFPLNQTKGNVAPGQVQVLNNNPFSIYEGIYEWVATSVRDERNANYVSKRVQSDLDTLDLSQALTFDFEELSEYWLCVGNKVWVYNYRVDVWYYFELYDTPTCFLTIDKELYFGTSAGQIMKFEDDLRSFNGQLISSEWHMGFYDWDFEWLRKFLSKTWISIKPETKAELDVYWVTDRDVANDTNKGHVGYNLMDYEQIDYENWSYETSYNPKPFRMKTKAKKFAYFKLILKNDSLTDKLTILSINLKGNIGGESK